MRWLPVVLATLLFPVAPARAQVSVGINIGIDVPVFPQLVVVPGTPVYYAPQADANYFFYDGMYWVYANDGWYASSWYDGPWHVVGPEYVPVYLLRVPVRYYREPPPYFRGWRDDRPPRWGEHYGHGWERRRAGWDRWDRRYVPRAAPLPAYQRQFSGDRYPRTPEQQRAIRSENYRYRPHEAVTRQQYQEGFRGGPREQHQQGYRDGPREQYQQGPRGGPRGEPQRQGPDRQREPMYQQPHGQPARQFQRQEQQQPPRQAQQQQMQPQPGPRGPPPQMQNPRGEPQDQRRGGPQGGGRENRNDERGQGHH